MTQWDSDPFAIPEFLKQPPAADPTPSRRRRRLIQSLAAATATVVVCVGVYAAEGGFVSKPRPVAAPQIAPLQTAATLETRLPELAALAPVALKPAEPADPPPQVVADATPAGRAAAEQAPAESGRETHGLDAGEIRFGMVSPFTGANRESGMQLKIGVETAFAQANEAGGVNGRKLRLIAADDGYEPARTLPAVRDLYEKKQVFGFVCDFGTATSNVALPYLLENRALYFGALSGAGLLRHDPPDRYVFNYRPSYGEETAAAVRYLIKVRRIQLREIAVFTQDDAFGDAGYDGVARTLRAMTSEDVRPPKLTYRRNTIDVNDAVKWLAASKVRYRAIVMAATFRAAAKFIEKTRDVIPDLIYTNVSAVGATSLAEELKLLGPHYAEGVVVTQVTPSVSGSASSVLKYKAALNKYFPGQETDYTSFEAYIDASIVIEALKRAGRDVDTEKLVDTLEAMRELDLGLGAPMRYSVNDHQASHKVWGTKLSAEGVYQPIDLD